MSESLFLGLVTHPRTRFVDSGTPDGLVRKAADAANAAGLDTHVQVNDRDLLLPHGISTTAHAIRQSIAAELRVERRWRRFHWAPGLHPAREGALSLELMARHTYRTLRYCPPWPRGHGRAQPGVGMITRLANIELSHIDLMRRAVEVGSTWALVVEDDAYTESVEEFVTNLIALIGNQTSERTPKYVNLSESFAEDRLRIGRGDAVVGSWGEGTRARRIVSYPKPVTNTVCAILYRTEFLRHLIPVLEAIPIEPVVPIDWKLNAGLMDMVSRGSLGEGDCWSVIPGPLIQRSMTEMGDD